MVQGLTEFLPVSSSGHLILARAFFGWDPGRFGIAFDVACHVGTLLAVVAFFRADVAKLIAAAPGALAGRDGDWERQGRLIIAGTIPIVIVGGLFADVIEAQLRSPLVVAITLTLGGIGLLVAERLGRKTREARTLGYGEAVLIGIAQAAALAPGVSRSGATLTMGMLLHLERASAARFVFLMSLPAIVAAAVKEGLDVAEVGLG
ncbi:MAG TPA: undecaprenyl-diphosphate phosphatase, partial [Steroidobacteraceae bacterium]|nr:undecaprenyl-diphosphate phosphatase [Steroidobacteraceae bacterium]